MSVGVERVDDVLLQAVNNTIQKFNIPVVCAAGNAGSDACMNSPARSVLTISVGSSDQHDNRSDFSNFGRCVDGYVPGEKVKGASIGREDLYTAMSGTSMASPLVTGIAAQLMQAKRNTTWSDIRDYIAGAYYRNPETLLRIVQAPPLTRVLTQKYNTTDLCSIILDQPSQVQVQVSKTPGAYLAPAQAIQVNNPGKISVSLAKVPAGAPAPQSIERPF
jgi:subtilisin family serine protease